MFVTSIGHGTMIVSAGDTTVLIDPVLTETFMDGIGAPQPRRDIDIAALPPIDAVIITHFHAGHLEPDSLALLDRSVTVFHPDDATVAAVLDDLGFTATVTVRPGQPVSFAGGTVRFTGTGQNFPYVGALFQSPEGAFWYMGDRGDTLPLPVVDRIVDEVGGIDLLVPSHPSDFHSFLLHSTWDGGAEEGETHDAWLRRTVRTVQRIRPRLFVPATTNFSYIGRAEWLNRFMFPMRPAEFVDAVRATAPELDGTVLDPGDVVELTDRRPAVHRGLAGFVVARPGQDRRGLDPTQPPPPVVDTNPEAVSAGELTTHIQRYLSDELAPWLDSHRGGYRQLLDSYRAMGVSYRITAVFDDDTVADWRVRLAPSGARVDRIGDEPAAYQELHTRIAASTLDRWTRDVIPYFTANVDCRRSGALWAMGRTADGAMLTTPVEARCLVSAHLMSQRERLDAWLATRTRPAATGVQVRACPAVSLLAVEDRIVVRHSDERRELELPAGQLGTVTSMLAALADWTDFATAAGAAGLPGLDGEAALLHLIDLNLVEVRGEGTGVFAEPHDWERLGWSDAYRYHRHIRAIPSPDWTQPDAAEQDMAMMREFLATEQLPPAYLDRPALRSVALGTGGSRDAGLLDTRTAPATTPVRTEDIEWLIRLSFGQTGTRRLPVTGEHVVKTSPSGGSRHPTEVYPVVLPGVGIEPGVYHYNVREHRLDSVRPGDFTETVRRDVIMLRHRPEFPPSVVFLLTSVVERSMFRYRDSRSYRVLYQDAGHLLQTFAYTASALGRPTYRGYTMRNHAVADLLGVAALEELPLAYGVLG